MWLSFCGVIASVPYPRINETLICKLLVGAPVSPSFLYSCTREATNLGRPRRNSFDCLYLRNLPSLGPRAPASSRRGLFATSSAPGIVEEVHCVPSSSVRRASICLPALSGHTYTHASNRRTEKASIANATRPSFVLRSPFYRRYRTTLWTAFTRILDLPRSFSVSARNSDHPRELPLSIDAVRMVQCVRQRTDRL